MKAIISIVAVVTVLSFAIAVGGTSQDEATLGQVQSAQSFASIEESIQANEGILLDVRTPEEYAQSYIDGADLLPLQQIQQEATPEVSTNTTIYLYCRSGNRSVEAAKILRGAGYEVVDLGGLQDVTAIGGELVRP